MAYTFLLHERYAEIHLTGVIQAPERLLPEELAEILRLGAVLYDYADVEGVEFDPWAVSDAARRLAERGVRIAGCAPRLEWFGVARQAAQLNNLEGPAFQLFRTRDEAVAWLTHPGCSGAK